MSKTAIYPGTFDPITFGHIDVIKKALKLFDKIVVAVSDGENKDYLFDAEERLEIVRNALFKDLKMNKKKITLISFKSLTTLPAPWPLLACAPFWAARQCRSKTLLKLRWNTIWA